ncbi:MAG: hypothetical protein AAF321_04950 [Pseudomonadota bacterium]
MTLDSFTGPPKNRTRKRKDWQRANERAKLTANYLNGLAIAILAVGVLRYVFEADGGRWPDGALLLPIGFSVAVHMAALLFLSRFEGD